MAEPEPAPANAPAGVRWRFLFFLTLITAGIVTAIAMGAYEIGGVGRDFRFVTSGAITGLAIIIAFFRGGFSLQWRALFLFVFIVLGFAAMKSIRRFHLDGAMIPVGIEWTWSPDPDEVLDNYRSKNRQVLGSASWEIVPEDAFADYRGPNRDGVSPGPALATDWTTRPPKLKWGPIPIGG